MRRPDSSIVANPILVGTTTLLTVLVAIFVTYNANNGLPFVPTYQVNAIVRDADLLGHNAEVRIGGKRVGLITAMPAEPTRSNVAGPATDIDGFSRGLDQEAAAMAPVSAQLGGLFDGAATTLHAVAREDRSFGRRIDVTPETERVATTSLQHIAPVLRGASRL